MHHFCKSKIFCALVSALINENQIKIIDFITMFSGVNIRIVIDCLMLFYYFPNVDLLFQSMQCRKICTQDDFHNGNYFSFFLFIHLCPENDGNFTHIRAKSCPISNELEKLHFIMKCLLFKRKYAILYLYFSLNGETK